VTSSVRNVFWRSDADVVVPVDEDDDADELDDVPFILLSSVCETFAPLVAEEVVVTLIPRLIRCRWSES
jgi:hypothetical protein